MTADNRRRPLVFLALVAAALVLTSGLLDHPNAKGEPPDTPGIPSDTAEGVAAEDDLLVKFRPDARPSEIGRLHTAANAAFISDITGIGVTRLRVPPGQVHASVELFRASSDVEFAEVDSLVEAQDLFPDDPLFANQWGLVKVKGPQAWSLVSGATPVTVAIIDTGVDAGHPDLAGKVLSGYNSIRDNDRSDDDNGHGTRVAGIAAAVSNNGQGVASVAWNSRIVPVKVLDRRGMGTSADVAEGIVWAADHGAQVLNLSLGGKAYSETMKAAVDYAWSKGAVIAAAAGNSAPYVLYPAAYENVIAVGATDELDERAWFSGTGPALDVVAPGVNVVSTAVQRDGTYASGSGTSFASPFVAGQAVMLLGAGVGGNAAVVSRIISTTDDLRACGWDDWTGWGRVNLFNSVTGAASSCGGGNGCPAGQDKQGKC
jgi:thermitase